MPTTQSLKPFDNESDAFQIDELTIENRLDRVSIYGSLELAKDKLGLARVLQLQELLDNIVKVLESERNLPEKIVDKPAEKVKNPFG